MSRGRFIAFEGGEACGKSTQAKRLAAELGAVLTREPGGTDIGERIRALLLDPMLTELHARTEALLMAAARAQHVAEVIEPALASGRDVVTDRFTGSSLAYQGYGRGLGINEVAELSAFATQGVQPDLTVLLQVGSALGPPSSPDRLESEDGAFHERVAKGFAELAAADPQRWVVIDGGRPVDEVALLVLEAVRTHFDSR